MTDHTSTESSRPYRDLCNLPRKKKDKIIEAVQILLNETDMPALSEAMVYLGWICKEHDTTPDDEFYRVWSNLGGFRRDVDHVINL